MHLWAPACPDDCAECGHRVCEGGDAVIQGLGDVDECPKQQIEHDIAELSRLSQLWRHWQKGNLACFVQNASESLGTYLCWLDAEIAELHAEEAERYAKA